MRSFLLLDYVHVRIRCRCVDLKRKIQPNVWLQIGKKGFKSSGNDKNNRLNRP